MTGFDPADEGDLLAAELALGLLDGEERGAAEARLGDPRFAALYRVWAERFAYLAAGEEAPPAAVWRAIDARVPANDAGRGTLRWWQAGTAVASVAALVLGIVALDRPAPPAPVVVPPAPAPVRPLVAVLAGKPGDGVVTVAYDPASGRLTTIPAALDVGRHAAELWVIPAGGKPRSMGLVAAAPVWSAPRPAIAGELRPEATLAISVEPAGGSPTGQPTGPVILSGKIVAS